jgi:hypothetical protein
LKLAGIASPDACPTFRRRRRATSMSCGEAALELVEAEGPTGKSLAEDLDARFKDARDRARLYRLRWRHGLS